MMLNYRIFVIYHDEIVTSYYHESIIDKLVFINVNPNNTNLYPHLNVVNLYEIKFFTPLGKWYAESEVIYNLYKNEYLTDGADYIGFIHYDIDFTNITDAFIQNAIAKAELVNLQPYFFVEDYKQKILMDPLQPNKLRGKGKNCYLGIFEEYNAFYKKKHKVEDHFTNGEIALCTCFIVKKTIFKEMMVFISVVIESKRLDSFDVEHNYRIQGGLLERYMGAWFLIKRLNTISYKLKHDFSQSVNELSGFNLLKRRVKNSLVFRLINNKLK